LAKRFGPDQPCLHWDLLKIIYCHECRGAGRDDRNLQFTNHAMTTAAEGLDALPIRPAPVAAGTSAVDDGGRERPGWLAGTASKRQA
jgi:hypothetical protein